MRGGRARPWRRRTSAAWRPWPAATRPRCRTDPIALRGRLLATGRTLDGARRQDRDRAARQRHARDRRRQAPIVRAAGPLRVRGRDRHRRPEHHDLRPLARRDRRDHRDRRLPAPAAGPRRLDRRRAGRHHGHASRRACATGAATCSGCARTDGAGNVGGPVDGPIVTPTLHAEVDDARDLWRGLDDDLEQRRHGRQRCTRDQQGRRVDDVRVHRSRRGARRAARARPAASVEGLRRRRATTPTVSLYRARAAVAGRGLRRSPGRPRRRTRSSSSSSGPPGTRASTSTGSSSSARVAARPGPRSAAPVGRHRVRRQQQRHVVAAVRYR